MKSKAVFNSKRPFCKRKYLLLATYASTELTVKKLMRSMTLFYDQRFDSQHVRSNRDRMIARLLENNLCYKNIENYLMVNT